MARIVAILLCVFAGLMLVGFVLAHFGIAVLVVLAVLVLGRLLRHRSG